MLDFVDDEDSSHYLDPNYYLTNLRPYEIRDTYTGDQLAAAQEAWHHSASVYGNIFLQATGNSVHFSADISGGYSMRTGTLDFYNNTMYAVPKNVWRYSWFDTGDNGINFTHYEWPTINAANLVAAGWTNAASPYFYWNSQRDAFINFGKVFLPMSWGTNVQNCFDNTIGACDGSGWAFSSNSDAYFNGNAFNVTGEGNFVTTSDSLPWDENYQLVTPLAGEPLVGSQAKMPVRFQYVPAGSYVAPRSQVVSDVNGGIIGATDKVALLPPVVLSISVSPTTISLATTQSITLKCTATLKGGSSRDCINPLSTSNNLLSASVTGLAVLATSSPGSGVISIAAEGFSAFVPFSVAALPAAPVSISVTPAAFYLVGNTSANLVCTTLLSDGTTRSCIDPVLSTDSPLITFISGLTVFGGAISGSGTLIVNAEGLIAKSSFSVKVPSLRQGIRFPELPDFRIGSYQLTARTTSGLPVIYKIMSGDATVVGSTLKVTGKGTVTIQAASVSDAAGNYIDATAVSRSFTAHE